MLGVSRDCSLAELNKRYRIMALKLHPDKNGNTPEATTAFQKMHASYETLKEYLSKLVGSNRQKYRKTKKTQKLRHKKHHRKTHRVRV